MFRVKGLDPAPFVGLYGASEQALAEQGAQRFIVDSKPGFPDRIELRDLEPGEAALLVNYAHQPAQTPYRSSHAIFIREGAQTAAESVDAIPEVMRLRTLSLRGFGPDHMMVDADLVEGHEAAGLVEQLFSDPRIAYIHAHYAKRGCFAALIERG